MVLNVFGLKSRRNHIIGFLRKMSRATEMGESERKWAIPAKSGQILAKNNLTGFSRAQDITGFGREMRRAMKCRRMPKKGNGMPLKCRRMP
jgi:hypothetical protein